MSRKFEITVYYRTFFWENEEQNGSLEFPCDTDISHMEILMRHLAQIFLLKKAKEVFLSLSVQEGFNQCDPAFNIIQMIDTLQYVVIKMNLTLPDECSQIKRASASEIIKIKVSQELQDKLLHPSDHVKHCW